MWRRRPDLNRGWWFCRQGLDIYVVDSSCFLVGPTPPFSFVFGRNCSQLVPTFGGSKDVGVDRAFVPPKTRSRGSPAASGPSSDEFQISGEALGARRYR